jgi:hypothetical protein
LPARLERLAHRHRPLTGEVGHDLRQGTEPVTQGGLAGCGLGQVSRHGERGHVPTLSGAGARVKPTGQAYRAFLGALPFSTPARNKRGWTRTTSQDRAARPDRLGDAVASGRLTGSETPLHYAASSDDLEVAEALIDGGADLEVPGGSIGTPLDNAVGYASA